MSTCKCVSIFIYLSCVFQIYSADSRPNIIIIYADNQDLMLGSPDFMPILQSHIVSNGKTFNNAFVNTPVCCPSRAELLSGRYFHNNGAPNGTCMSINAYNAVFDETNLFQKLYNNGYKTGGFGKIMNEVYWWCNTSNPNLKGFSRLYIPCNYMDYYGHTYLNKFMNGTWKYSLTNTSYIDPSLYQTSQIGNATINWIHEMYATNNSNDRGPFFALWGVHAPHMPATPAMWYMDLFNDSTVPTNSPAFNQHYNDKHWMIANEPFVDDNAMIYVNQLWKDRLRSMLSVDDFIYELFEVLKLYDILDNTYVFYTSDHGYHFCQWQIPMNMRQPYDSDIRVPMYVFGPNISSKSFNDKIIGNVDFAPTIYDLVGISFDRDNDKIDGRSFAKYLFNDEIINDKYDEWRDVFLTEFRSTGVMLFSDYWIWFPSNNSFEGINVNGPKTNLENGQVYYIDHPNESNYRSLRILNETHNLIYAEFVGYNWTEYDLLHPLFYEMYNVTTDLWQTRNIYNQTDEDVLNELHEMLLQYTQCKGSQCP